MIADKTELPFSEGDKTMREERTDAFILEGLSKEIRSSASKAKASDNGVPTLMSLSLKAVSKYDVKWGDIPSDLDATLKVLLLALVTNSCRNTVYLTY